MPLPTRRLAIAAAALAVVAVLWPGGRPSLWLLNGALLTIAVIDLLMVPARDAVDVERDPPAVIPLGGEATTVLRLRNTTQRTLRASVADALPPSLGAVGRRFDLTLPAGATGEARTVLRPQRRGRFAVPSITVRLHGRLGLAARQWERDLPATIRVYPSFHSRDEAELRVNKGRLLEVGLRSAVGRGGGTDFETLREYTPDDEFRRLDWAATARTGRPIVRTYRAERNQTVLLLLDTGRTMAGQVAGVPRLEHAMDAVMMLTTVCSRLGDRVGLLAFDQETRAVVPPRAGRSQLGVVTEAMYELEPRLVESDYAGAFVDTLGRFRRRSLLVVLSELSAQAVTETLLPAVPRIARDHLVVVASVSDPAVAAWASSVPGTPSEGYRKAAAVAASEERRRVAARLRGIGVTVVDEPPGRLSPALADAYLRVKATGRL